MLEIEFKAWLINNGDREKITSDHISRIKRLERELNHCDIDEEYKKDKCTYIISLFKNKGINKCMEEYNSKLPIGKYYLASYVYSIRKYLEFKKSSLK